MKNEDFLHRRERTASHHVPPGRGRCRHATDGRSGSSSRDRAASASGSRPTAQSGDLVVNRVIEGGAAARDGRIKVGDRLRGIESEGGEGGDFRGKSPEEVAGLIRGPAGTKVRVVVVPKGQDGREVVELTRAAAGYGVVAHRVKTRTPVTIDPAAFDPLVPSSAATGLPPPSS